MVSRAVVDTLSSTVSRQSRFFDCRQVYLAVSTDPPCRDSPDCRDLEVATVDRQMSDATTALMVSYRVSLAWQLTYYKTCQVVT